MKIFGYAGKMVLLFGVATLACNGHTQAYKVAGEVMPQVAPKSALLSEPLEIKLTRSKVVMVDGKETRTSATTARPGEILEEVATYTNRSKAALSGVEATLPVPANTELILSSVKEGDTYGSIDGNRFSPIPLKRKVKLVNGDERDQMVPPGEYRFLRWYPGLLAAGGTRVFSARFKVANDAEPGTTSSKSAQ